MSAAERKQGRARPITFRPCFFPATRNDHFEHASGVRDRILKAVGLKSVQLYPDSFKAVSNQESTWRDEMLGKLTLLSVAVGAVTISPASAQNSTPKNYSPEDVVQFMVAKEDLGLERRVCIGAKSQCAEPDSGSPGFDMLLRFDLNSAELTPEAKANLEKIAVALNDSRLRNMRFRVEGHTDALGTDAYNQRLSDERAKSVTAFLLQHHVSAERINAVGLGEKAPRTGDPFDPSNRRVELKNQFE